MTTLVHLSAAPSLLHLAHAPFKEASPWPFADGKRQADTARGSHEIAASQSVLGYFVKVDKVSRDDSVESVDQ